MPVKIPSHFVKDLIWYAITAGIALLTFFLLGKIDTIVSIFVFWTIVLYAMIQPVFRSKRIGVFLFSFILLLLLLFWIKTEQAVYDFLIQEFTSTPGQSHPDPAHFFVLFSSVRMACISMVHKATETLWLGSGLTPFVGVMVLGCVFLEDKIKHFLLDRIHRRYFEFFAYLSNEISTTMVRYIRKTIMQGLFFSVLWGLALRLLHFPFAIELALLFFICFFIPTAGMWTGMLLTALFLLEPSPLFPQILGGVITIAVVWLFKITLFHRDFKYPLNAQFVLPFLIFAFCIKGIVGLLILTPIFVLTLIWTHAVREGFQFFHPFSI